MKSRKTKWSDEELKQLAEIVAAGGTPLRAAAKLNRNMTSCRSFHAVTGETKESSAEMCGGGEDAGSLAVLLVALEKSARSVWSTGGVSGASRALFPGAPFVVLPRSEFIPGEVLTVLLLFKAPAGHGVSVVMNLRSPRNHDNGRRILDG